MLKPCLQEIKARWNLSERNPSLAHTSNENGGKTEASLGLVGGLPRTHWRVLAQVCIPIFWGSHAGQQTHRGCVLSTSRPCCLAAPLPCLLIYWLRWLWWQGHSPSDSLPELHKVPSSRSVKFLRAPGPVWWFWRALACTQVVGSIQGANCSNAFTLLPYECVCVSQSEGSLNNLVVGFRPPLHPFTALYVLPLGMWRPFLSLSGSDWTCRDRWQSLLQCEGRVWRTAARQKFRLYVKHLCERQQTAEVWTIVRVNMLMFLRICVYFLKAFIHFVTRL